MVQICKEPTESEKVVTQRDKGKSRGNRDVAPWRVQTQCAEPCTVHQHYQGKIRAQKTRELKTGLQHDFKRTYTNANYGKSLSQESLKYTQLVTMMRNPKLEK